MKHPFSPFGLSIDNSSDTKSATVVRPAPLNDSASLQHHVKLQQHQEEFLAWLEATEISGKNENPYKKIR